MDLDRHSQEYSEIVSDFMEACQKLDESAFLSLVTPDLFPSHEELARITFEIVRAGRRYLVRNAIAKVLTQITSDDEDLRLAATQAIMAALMDDVLSDRDLATLSLPWSLCYAAIKED